MPSTRRRALRALGLVFVSGCAGSANDAPSATPPATDRTTATPTRMRTPTPTAPQSSGPGPVPHLGDVVLWNDDDTPHTLSLTVRRDGTHVRTLVRELAPGASTRVPNPIDRQGQYLLTASLETNRPRRIEWPIESCANAEYLQCFVDRDGTLGLRVLRQTIDPPPTCE
jgi:hypothetical protein